MRFPVSRRAAWLIPVVLAWMAQATAYSAPPLDSPLPLTPPGAASSPITPSAPESTPAPDPQAAIRQVLEKALELERQHNWQAAIQAYDEAHENWPSYAEFNHRRRLCETHYKLVRRYQDQSFRNVLLRLPKDKALALYDELLERIETHYVDPVPVEPMVRRGIDNLEVALRDPDFLKANNSAAAADRVKWLRETLQSRRLQINTPDRAAARTELLAVCDLTAKNLRLGPTPVVLEFIYGACDALDDYTSYLTPDKLDDLYAMIDGNFVGLGIELKLDTEGLRLVGVIRGGPAYEAGLKIGDQIVQVGTKAVRGLSLDEAANRLQGTEGTAVDIQVLRTDGTRRSYRIVRRHVEVESVAQSRLVDTAGGVGYIQLIGFQKNSAEELDKAIAALKRQGMRALVIDLRGNPGGLLNVAVEIAERFIDRGVIVSTRGRAPGQSQVYRAHSQAIWNLPLLVLIDHDSASASEILAGALKDHNRAVIVGQKSYGKGSVQSIFALRNAPAGLKLTTAKFYSPRNRPYSEQGVEPDVPVQVVAKPAQKGNGASASDQDRPEETFGDPQRDMALRMAIARAKRWTNSIR